MPAPPLRILLAGDAPAADARAALEAAGFDVSATGRGGIDPGEVARHPAVPSCARTPVAVPCPQQPLIPTEPYLMRRVIWVIFGVLVLAALAVLLPFSPVYLPELLSGGPQYEGKSARRWARALNEPEAQD